LKDTQLKKAQVNPSLCFDFCDVNLKAKQKASTEVVATTEGYRKVRHSAAMIGLALSVGATGILVPKGDQAVLANEPTTDELSLTAVAPINEPEAKANQVLETNSVVSESSTSNHDESLEPKVANQDSTLTEVKAMPTPTFQHELKKGDTLWELSQEYQVTTEQIANSNQISPDDKIIAGETIKIPVENANVDLDSVLKQKQGLEKQLSLSTAGRKSDQSEFSGQEIAVIPPQKIEQSSEVAPVLPQNQNNQTALNVPASQPQVSPSTIIPETALLPSAKPTSVDFHNFSEPINIPVPLPGVQEQIQPSTQNNNLSNNSNRTVNLTAQPQEIPIPVEQPIAFASTSSELYTVRQGDTLDIIARNHGLSVSELMEENNLTNPHLIKVNQQLKLPEQSATNNNATNQRTVALVQESNQSLPTPSATNFVDTANATDEGVNRMTQQVNRFKEEASAVNNDEQNNTIALNTSTSFNQPIEIPVDPYRSVNPEWQPENNVTPAPQTNIQPTQPVQRTNTARVNPTIQQQPEELIAAAPISSGNYNPMLEVPVGETVAPQLPDLASADQYLPSARPNFEGYIWPTKGVISSGYGWRWGRMHKGIDIAAPIGTPVVAAANGEVIFSGWNSGGYGNLVKIRHEDGSVTFYAHNNKLLVRTGQYVTQGQQISEMGSTGRSTGPHLHFEVRPSGNQAVNPISYLPRR